jgi:hypothetical protein
LAPEFARVRQARRSCTDHFESKKHHLGRIEEQHPLNIEGSDASDSVLSEGAAPYFAALVFLAPWNDPARPARPATAGFAAHILSESMGQRGLHKPSVLSIVEGFSHFTLSLLLVAFDAREGSLPLLKSREFAQSLCEHLSGGTLLKDGKLSFAGPYGIVLM